MTSSAIKALVILQPSSSHGKCFGARFVDARDASEDAASLLLRLLVGLTNPVVGDGYMGNVARTRFRHVATHAIVLGTKALTHW